MFRNNHGDALLSAMGFKFSQEWSNPTPDENASQKPAKEWKWRIKKNDKHALQLSGHRHLPKCK